jgi:hypothetical protein
LGQVLAPLVYEMLQSGGRLPVPLRTQGVDRSVHLHEGLCVRVLLRAVLWQHKRTRGLLSFHIFEPEQMGVEHPAAQFSRELRLQPPDCCTYLHRSTGTARSIGLPVLIFVHRHPWSRSRYKMWRKSAEILPLAFPPKIICRLFSMIYKQCQLCRTNSALGRLRPNGTEE